MILLPAIDLYEKKAVRLLHGDYAQMTVYSDDPVAVAKNIRACGADWLHVVDLEGAKTADTPHLSTVCAIKEQTGLHIEIGGGIRSEKALRAYESAGVDRMILGTAAVHDEAFLDLALSRYGDKIAVGADLKDGLIAVRGWTETSAYTADAFFGRMQALGVKTVICTDISRDGAMRGSNRELYKELSTRFSLDLIASGGVSSLDDVEALRALNIYGAIVGKAYYTGALDLKKALEVAK